MSPGEDRLSPVGWQAEATSVDLFIGPMADEVFVFAQSWHFSDEHDPAGPPVEATLECEELAAVARDGFTRTLELPPSPGRLWYAERIVGFDHRGRLILLGVPEQSDTGIPLFDRVDALDVTTNQVMTIYP